MSTTMIASVSADRPETRLATRLAFFVAGFGIACWAPLVPFAKERLGVEDGVLGLLLLSLGVGSVVAMGGTGAACARFGVRPVILASGFALAAVLPLLTVVATPFGLGATLFAFGAALGSLDVAVNIHAVEVERAAGRPLMSGFHALFSIGGFAGAAAMTAFLSLGLVPLAGTLIAALAMAAATALARPGLIAGTSAAGGPLFARPRGIVLLIAVLAAVTFLVEGAVLDWSAVLVTGRGLLDEARGGLAYMAFSVAMTIGRLGGDAVVMRLGDRRVLIGGSLLAIAGFAVALLASGAAMVLLGFLLVGLGASNLVPVLFRRAGSQRVMPAGLAIAAITTAGYAGILVGPAGIGFLAEAVGLSGAFWILAAAMGLVTVTAGSVTASDERETRR